MFLMVDAATTVLLESSQEKPYDKNTIGILHNGNLCLGVFIFLNSFEIISLKVPITCNKECTHM
jgi:hypothetical protein